MALKPAGILSPPITSVEHWRTYATRLIYSVPTFGQRRYNNDLYQTVRRAGKSYTITGLTYDAAVATGKCKIAQYTRPSGIYSDVEGWKESAQSNDMRLVPDGTVTKCTAQVRIKPTGPAWQVSVELDEEDVFEYFDYDEHGPDKLDTTCSILNRLPVDSPSDLLRISYTRLSQPGGWVNQPVLVLSHPHSQGFPFVYRVYDESWRNTTTECRDWTEGNYDTIFIPVLDTVFRIEDPHNDLISPTIYIPSHGMP